MADRSEAHAAALALRTIEAYRQNKREQELVLLQLACQSNKSLAATGEPSEFSTSFRESNVEEPTALASSLDQPLFLQQQQPERQQEASQNSQENEAIAEDDLDEILINEVRQFRCLWDTRSRSYKENPKKTEAWKTISKRLGIHGETLFCSLLSAWHLILCEHGHFLDGF